MTGNLITLKNLEGAYGALPLAIFTLLCCDGRGKTRALDCCHVRPVASVFISNLLPLPILPHPLSITIYLLGDANEGPKGLISHFPRFFKSLTCN